MGSVVVVTVLAAGITLAAALSSCAATAPNVVFPSSEDEIQEGARFLGDYQTFDIYLLMDQSVTDSEPMYVAKDNVSGDLVGFFRAGEAQCYDKFNSVPIPCEVEKETGWILPPTNIPQYLFPGTGILDRPPVSYGTSSRPPIDCCVTEQPAAVPLPPTILFYITAVFWLFRRLFVFSNEYEDLRAQCCGNPDILKGI